VPPCLACWSGRPVPPYLTCRVGFFRVGSGFWALGRVGSARASLFDVSGWVEFWALGRVGPESRLEGGGVNRVNLNFINLSTTTSRVSVRNINESEREGGKQIVSK
jgi:hypothetical protein